MDLVIIRSNIMQLLLKKEKILTNKEIIEIIEKEAINKTVVCVEIIEEKKISWKKQLPTSILWLLKSKNWSSMNEASDRKNMKINVVENVKEV